MHIAPLIDTKNLLRELSENKIRALELIREALSNAKDHGADSVYIRTTRQQRNEVSVLFIDDGNGMSDAGLAAFWGIGATEKPGPQLPIGYKGHGTKLFFGSQRLTVATRTRGSIWRLTSRERPAERPEERLAVTELTTDHPLHVELDRLGLLGGTGTAIHSEHLAFADAQELLIRKSIESMCVRLARNHDQFRSLVRRTGAARRVVISSGHVPSTTADRRRRA